MASWICSGCWYNSIRNVVLLYRLFCFTEALLVKSWSQFQKSLEIHYPGRSLYCHNLNHMMICLNLDMRVKMSSDIVRKKLNEAIMLQPIPFKGILSKGKRRYPTVLFKHRIKVRLGGETTFCCYIYKAHITAGQQFLGHSKALFQ